MGENISINITKNQGLTQGLAAYAKNLKGANGGKIDAKEWDATVKELAKIQEERKASNGQSIFSGGSEKGDWHKNMVVQEGTVNFSDSEMKRLLATMGVNKDTKVKTEGKNGKQDNGEILKPIKGKEIGQLVPSKAKPEVLNLPISQLPSPKAKDGKITISENIYSEGKDGKPDKLLQKKKENGNTLNYTYDENGKLKARIEKDSKENQTHKVEYKHENGENYNLVYGSDSKIPTQKIVLNKDGRVAIYENYDKDGKINEIQTNTYESASKPAAQVTTSANGTIKSYNPNVSTSDNYMQFISANNGQLLTKTEGNKTYEINPKTKANAPNPENLFGDLKNLAFLADPNNWIELIEKKP